MIMLRESMHNSLFKILLRNEKKWGNQIYLKQPRSGVWHHYTWAEVMLQARRVAAFLHQSGLPKGSNIAIISKNCAEWFITDFGIHLAGMVCVPLFSNQREESINYVLQHAEIALVFVGKLDDHQLVRHYIPEHYVTVSFDYHHDLKVNYRWSDIMDVPPIQDLVEPKADDLYTIIYSSGTTGLPKGAMYTNQTIANYLALFPRDLLRVSHSPHYRLVSYLPLAHVYERSAIELGSVIMPSDVSFIESLTRFSKNLQKIRPTFFTAVPRIWGVFQQRIEEKISIKALDFLLKIPLVSYWLKYKIKTQLGLAECTNFFSGASPLPLPIMNFFDKLGIHIQEGYGQTENLAYATLSLLHERQPGYVGTPRLEVDIKLDEANELLCRSPCLMSGYYKEKEASKNAFTTDGWLRTGDIAELNNSGQVKISGRISENYKNQSGEFVAPTPIEHQFENNELIEQLCMVGRGLPYNVVLIILNNGVRATKTREEIDKSLEETMHRINNGLAKYERIHQIIIVKEDWTPGNGLLTPTLKVMRRSVDQYYSNLIQSSLKQTKRVIWE